MEKNGFRTTLGAPGRERIKRVHFVGIGGVGMCGIAEVLLGEGYNVSGSDRTASAVTKRLEEQGVKIFIGHAAGNVEGIDVMVTSTAIKDDNVEIVQAHKLQIPVVARAEMLAELMRFRYGIAISGTHGKTTTTSLVSSVLAEGGLDPTFVIGGRLNSISCNARLGDSRYLVTEADESDASFLCLLPMMSVVTNIDVDHMDTYDGDINKLYDAFVSFFHQLPFYGLAIVCIDDEGVQQVLSRISRPLMTYGFSEKADVRALSVKYNGTKTQFSVRRKHHSDLNITLNLPGDHNVSNALAAICVATELGIKDKVIEGALQSFAGVGRRFQVLGELTLPTGTATIVDDYAHHPRELAATIKAARCAWPNRRLVMVFQPHRFTRTRDLFEDFVQTLNEVDLLLLMEVYPAGEKPIVKADTRSLSRSVRQLAKLDPILILDKKKVTTTLQNIARDGDVILMCGAGDIGSLAQNIIQSAGQVATVTLKEGDA